MCREFLQKHNERVRNWRNALKQVSGLAGWDPYVVRDEAALVRKIVDEISCKLNRVHPQIMKEGLVGMDDREKAVKDMLRLDADDAVITVGICGVDGLGKTTIARVVYDSIRSSFKFDSSCFLADVGENYEKYGPCFLQEQLILETAEPVKIWTPDIGTAEIKYRLQIKKILLVLDDVSSLKQLKVLAADPSWFGKGTRIIITCRDEHLLRAYGVNREYIYKPETLSYDESLALFCSKAFKQTPSDENYLELCYQALDYAQGFPLALERLGSFLCGKDLMEWRSALRRLKGIPNIEIMDDPDDTPKTEIMNVLRRSYDGLNELEKQIFLDIACFFKGMNKDRVATILDSFGFHSKIGLQVLIDKSLITESSGKLQMHDLLQKMGWEIVRQESCKDPGRRSRLWKYEDVREVMMNNKQSDKVEGIFLDFSETGQQWNDNIFSKMIGLRLLIIRNGHLANGQTTLPNALQFLEWNGYPLTSLPPFFEPYKLVELDLSQSNIKELWRERKTLLTLKAINLSNSQNLIKTPDFTGIPNLERLNFKGCIMLSEVHPSVGHLKKLKYLNMASCKKVKKFPVIVENMECLEELRLDETGIKELSDSIHLLTGLHLLSLKGCKDLLCLPSSINSLTSLRNLCLSGCRRIASIPGYIALKKSLVQMDTSGTAISSSLKICSLALILPKCNKEVREVAMDLACFSLLTRLQPRQDMSLLYPPLPKIRRYQSHHSLATQSSSNFANELEETRKRSVDLLMREHSSLRLKKIGDAQGEKEDRPFKLDMIITENAITFTMRQFENAFTSKMMVGFTFNRHYGNFWPWTLVRLSLADCNLLDATIPYDLLTQLWSLEHLDLRGNLMRRLSNRIKSLTKLQNLLLDRCRNLISLPELPESLDLLSVRDCTSLVVQSPFLFSVNQPHPMLRCGLLDFVINYHTNPFGFYLSRSSYREYPCESFLSLNVLERVERGSLEKLKLLLRLKKTGIVGFSIFKSEASHQNFRSECQKTKQSCAIPESFVSVESITSPINILPCDLLELDLKYCSISDDNAILKNFSSLVFLQYLNLSGNLISRLPESIKGLAELRTLKLSRCKKLQSLPELPAGLEELKLYCCSSLKKVVNLPNLFVSLKLDVRDCDNLVEVQELFILKPMENTDVQTICDMRLLQGKFSEGIEVQMFNFMTYSVRKTSLQILHECGIVSVYLPGGKVPYWFSYNMEGSSSLVLTVPPSIVGDKTWSLNLCVVYGLLCTLENNELPLLMARVCNETKGLKWTYCPTFIGIPSESETMLWFSRWKFKHQLESGDRVVISFAYSADFSIKQFGVDFVCGDEDVDMVSNTEATVKGSSLYNQSLHDDDIFVYKVQGASFLLSNHHYPASPDKFWLDQFLHSHPDFI